MADYTKAQIYTMIKENIGSLTLSDEIKEQIVARMDKDIAMANKTSNATRKPTEKQIANDAIREIIVQVLSEATSPMTIAQICENDRVSAKNPTHNQVVALLNGFVKDNTLTKTYNKKVAQYEITPTVE